MASKYYFSDILSEYKNFKELPEDINNQLYTFIEQYRKQFEKDINIEQDFIRPIKFIQACHFYGPLSIINKAGEIIIVIEFQYGVFSIIKVQKKFSNQSIFYTSIKNHVCKFGGKTTQPKIKR